MNARPRDHATPSGSVTLRDTEEGLRDLVDTVVAAADDAGYPEASAFALRLVIEEAVVNAFKHGNAGDYDAGVDVQWAVTPERVRLSVEDRGTGFDPDAVPDPTADERLEVPSGRGLLLMRAYMTEVRHNDRGNRVEMVYKKPAKA